MSTSTFIVTFDNDTPDDMLQQQILAAQAAGAKIIHRYSSPFRGFSLEVPDKSVSAMSLCSPFIQSVEADGKVTTQGESLLK